MWIVTPKIRFFIGLFSYVKEAFWCENSNIFEIIVIQIWIFMPKILMFQKKLYFTSTILRLWLSVFLTWNGFLALGMLSWPLKILGSKYWYSSLYCPCLIYERNYSYRITKNLWKFTNFCTSINSSTILVTGKLCFLTTRFLTPSMTKDEDCCISLENMETVLVPPPL